MPPLSAFLAIDIKSALIDITSCTCANAKGRAMYGGVFYETRPGDYKTGFCGVFCYKAHVSLEFTHGVHLNDPAKILEGSGKLRRHIKLRSLQDLQEKSVETYIKQAYALQIDSD